MGKEIRGTSCIAALGRFAEMFEVRGLARWIRGSSTMGGTLRITLPAHDVDLTSARPIRASVRVDARRSERAIGLRAPPFRRSPNRSKDTPWQAGVVVLVPGSGGRCHAALHQRGTLRLNRVRGVDRLVSGPLRSNVRLPKWCLGPESRLEQEATSARVKACLSRQPN